MGTLICTVELNKTPGDGVKVTIDNADAGVTQTIQMDGTSVTISVKKGGDTSSYTQTATSVTIKCKTFEVEASDTIKMTSTNSSTYESTSGTVTVQANEDLTLKSAVADIVATALNIEATGQTEVTLAVAANKLDLGAAGVTLSSPANTSISGGVVAIKADGMLTVESSGVATLKGTLTNVQGSLINLG